MRNRFHSLIAVVLVMALLLSLVIPSALAGSDVTVDVSAKFMYSEARSMLDMVNEFRTGEDAYYVDTDNRTMVRVDGLKKLQYDYNLEKTAMLRAMEIAVYFSHTRPNGQKWSTAHSGRYTMGENIAYGFGSVKAAFNGFREDDEDYAGQGHRRNMLNRKFTRVGFGCVKVGNTLYWSQEFGSGSAGGSSSDKFSAKSVDAIWKTLRAGRTKINVSVKELTITAGESVELPKVILTSSSGAKNSLHKNQWTSSNKKVAKVKGSKLKALQEGKTNLTIDVDGTKLKIKVKVVSGSETTATAVESLDDYDTPLGLEDMEMFFQCDEDEGFLDESDLPEEGE